MPGKVITVRLIQTVGDNSINAAQLWMNLFLRRGKKGPESTGWFRLEGYLEDNREVQFDTRILTIAAPLLDTDTRDGYHVDIITDTEPHSPWGSIPLKLRQTHPNCDLPLTHGQILWNANRPKMIRI